MREFLKSYWSLVKSNMEWVKKHRVGIIIVNILFIALYVAVVFGYLRDFIDWIREQIGKIVKKFSKKK